jgi:hypothetical protein
MKADVAPRLLSLEFHAHYLPALLRGRLRFRERAGTGFSSTFEFHVMFVICVILAVIGIPVGLSHRSIVGLVVGGIGAAGVLALFIISIVSRGIEPPTYDCFLIGVFFFFVALGISAGVFVGTLGHSLMLGLLSGSAGLLAGYLLGILAGLWLQYLGWLSGIVDLLAGLAVIGMLCADLVLLSGALFG